MKNRKKRKNIRFKTTWSYQSSKRRLEEMRPEDLVVHIRRAEREVLPIIKEIQASPAAAQLLLAQYTYVLATGSNQFSEENAIKAANTIMLLWKNGSYVPSPNYPFTLEETLREIEGGIRPKKDYAAYFQAFNPLKGDQPRGIGQVSAGIVKHPETKLWQIWMMIDRACEYLGAYHNSSEAQRNLEEIIQSARRGSTEVEIEALYKKVQSRGDGLPKQLSFDMMTYLIEHIHLYNIEL